MSLGGILGVFVDLTAWFSWLLSLNVLNAAGPPLHRPWASSAWAVMVNSLCVCAPPDKIRAAFVQSTNPELTALIKHQ